MDLTEAREAMALGHVKSITLETQITRADGTVEPKKVAAYWHRNPLKRLVARLRKGVRGKVRPCA